MKTNKKTFKAAWQVARVAKKHSMDIVPKHQILKVCGIDYIDFFLAETMLLVRDINDNLSLADRLAIYKFDKLGV